MWDKETIFIKGQEGGGEMAGEAVDFLIRKGLPYMAKKSVEMARYYGSEALRNKNLQKKAINLRTEEAHSCGTKCWF